MTPGGRENAGGRRTAWRGRVESRTWLGRAADRLVESVSPAAACRRYQARGLLASDDGFDISRPSRTRRRFVGGGGPADRHQDVASLWQLREICRRHDRNSALLAGLLNTASDEIVGPTFAFDPCSGDAAFNEAAEKWIRFRMEAEQCDYNGALCFGDLLRTTLRACWTDGDCLHVWTEGGRLQSFEAQDLVSPRGGFGSGPAPSIVNGVEKSGGRTVAYWLARPQAANDYGYVATPLQAQRVPAEACLFPAVRKRFNQTRGVPFLAACLSTFDRLETYLDNEMLAAEMNAKAALKITREPSDTSNLPGAETRTDANSGGESITTFDQALRLEPGMVFDLRPLEDIAAIAPDRPGVNFEPFVVTICRIVGVGVGFPLELFLKDFSKANYSSMRGGLTIARRSFRGWQRFLERHVALPWHRRQIEIGIASGALPLPATGSRQPAIGEEATAEFDPYGVRCVWPAWEYLDPAKEAAGHELALKNRTKSRSQIIREQSEEPDRVFAEIADEEDELRGLGVPLATDHFGGAGGPGGQGTDGAAASGDGGGDNAPAGPKGQPPAEEEEGV